jgi:transposase
MQTITTIGLDIAKSVFQVHSVDAAGQVIVRRQLKRRQVIARSVLSAVESASISA